MDVILGQLRNTSKVPVSVKTGSTVRVPFNVVDYEQNCKGYPVHSFIKTTRDSGPYTVYFTLSLGLYQREQRVSIPIEVYAKVNGKVVGQSTPGINTFGINKTIFSGAIPIPQNLPKGSKVELYLQNLSKTTDIIFEDSIMILNTGAVAYGDSDRYIGWYVSDGDSTSEVGSQAVLAFLGVNGISTSLASGSLVIDGQPLLDQVAIPENQIAFGTGLGIAGSPKLTFDGITLLVDSMGYFYGDLTAPKHITIGGTVDDFVKGDGSLANYIDGGQW